MPRAEVGTPKYLANAMKSKGLQRLRWYCQACQKQCRDENGFKCHTQSEPHLRQILLIGENAGQHISNFSMEFQHDFVQLLSRRFGTKRVLANRVYQDYIQDKNHIHMNATRWVTLSEFVKHLGRTGVARVDETEKGWFIAWIDNSPKALEKAEASMKKERANMSDEQRERMLIAEQIERAKAEQEALASKNNASGSGSGSGSENGDDSSVANGRKEAGLLKRDDDEKVVLQFSLKPSAPAIATGNGEEKEEEEVKNSTSAGSSTTVHSTLSNGGVKLNGAAGAKLGFGGVKKSNALSSTANPVKRPNVFKIAANKGKDKEKINEITEGREDQGGKKRDRDSRDPSVAMSVAERLIVEDQERKRRRMDRERERGRD